MHGQEPGKAAHTRDVVIEDVIFFYRVVYYLLGSVIYHQDHPLGKTERLEAQFAARLIGEVPYFASCDLLDLGDDG